ncbi:MAG TPA: hypothetical protein PKD51_01365 [Saprospiraceae bacterium]|nr:hypothetical protein [Saprospiraceae bacterium]
MKSFIKNTLHKILLPRGRAYQEDKTLLDGWNKINMASGLKSICAIHKETTSISPKGVVFLSHPYLADAKQFFLRNGHAQMYLEGGFHVTIFDYNGFGESKFSDFNYAEDFNIVVKYFRNIFPDTLFYGHGISFGASNLINYTNDSSHQLNKIIIENCLDSNLTYYKKRNIKLYYLMRALMKVFPFANKNHDYSKGVQSIKNVSDALFLYNTEDTLTTIEMGEKLQKNCIVPSQMVIFGGKHLEAFVTEPERYKLTVANFIINN